MADPIRAHMVTVTVMEYPADSFITTKLDDEEPVNG